MADKPAMDPAEILTKLEGIIKANQAPASTRPASSSSSSKSWIAAIIIGVVVLVAIAVWSWLSWRNGRELAALRHEKEKTRILAEQAALLAKLAEGTEVNAASQRAVVQAKEDLRIIEADIVASEASYEADRRAIDRIRSWDDVPSAR